ncbi:hypothetical protein DFH28DRAFT_1047762 [Melampsora americana]|nr:hypothetical protein DFH28DRAFT_1047762 [Melampsora americana]
MMAALPETRTVTTNGVLHKPSRFLKSDNPVEVFTRLTYEHCLYDPRRSPAEHVYRTKCPHEFRLQKRTSATAVGTSAMGQLNSVEREKQVVEELVVHLSDSVHQMYAEWTMFWKFTVNSEFDDRARTISQHTITPYSSPAEWKTITVGKVKDIRGLFKGSHGLEDALHFTISWTREEIPLALLDATRRELEGLKRAMLQTHTTLLDNFKQPSIDMTRLVFRSKCGKIFKNLYVPSRLLDRFEYFQKYHSSENSETQRLDKAKRKRDEKASPSEDLPWDDSDEEWDSDSDNAETDKDTTFKATIHVVGTSRRTYQAFIDYAISGALYFAPLRSAYRQYRNTPSIPVSENGQLQKVEASQSQPLENRQSQPPEKRQSQPLENRQSQPPEKRQSQPPENLPSQPLENGQLQAVENDQLQPLIPWPEWAKAHCTSHTVVPGFTTLSSPKSLHRLANMLNIPELKAICHQQIIHSLDVRTVISEIESRIFTEHEELRVEAYEWIQKNWSSFPSSDLISLIKNLSEEEAALIVKYTLKDLKL